MLTKFLMNERAISYLYSTLVDRVEFLIPDSNFLWRSLLIIFESLYIIQSAASLSEPSNLIWFLWILSFFYPIDSKEWNMMFLLIIWTRGLILKTSDKKNTWFKIFFTFLNSYSLMSLLFKTYFLLEVALLPNLSCVDSWEQIERSLVFKPINLTLWFWRILQELSSV